MGCGFIVLTKDKDGFFFFLVNLDRDLGYLVTMNLSSIRLNWVSCGNADHKRERGEGGC